MKGGVGDFIIIIVTWPTCSSCHSQVKPSRPCKGPSHFAGSPQASTRLPPSSTLSRCVPHPLASQSTLRMIEAAPSSQDVPFEGAVQSDCSQCFAAWKGCEAQTSGTLTWYIDLSKHLGPWHVQVSRCLVELDVDGSLCVEQLQAKLPSDWALDHALLPVHLAVIHTPCKASDRGS